VVSIEVGRGPASIEPERVVKTPGGQADAELMGPAATSPSLAGQPAAGRLPAPRQTHNGHANHGHAEAAWPLTVRMAFAPVPPAPGAAAAFTWRLAHEHYENFSVVSALLPRRLRQDFCNVYAFCRIADDLGDEVADRDTALQLLDRFRDQTELMYAGQPGSIVFAALAETVAKYSIPARPFLDLIDAFEQDQRVDRYDTFDAVRDYCRRSADPVGRLVLYMAVYRDEHRQRLSDCTCTALQLANFWQDVRRDILDRDRIYLPRETMDRFGVTEAQLRAGRASDGYRAAIRFECDRASDLLDQGEGLLPLLDDGVRPQVSLFGQGGRAILSAIRGQGYDTLARRPTVSRWSKGQLVLRAMAGRLRQIVERDMHGEGSA
jgi:squalene synthase HpnC